MIPECKKNKQIESTNIVHNNQLLSEIIGNRLEDSGWQFITNFQNDAEGYTVNPPRYRKIGNIVYLDGLFTSGNDESVQFILPQGYIPKYAFSGWSIPNGAQTATLWTRANGEVIIARSVKGSETRLSGINFFID